MPMVKRFLVVPTLPPQLAPLTELAYNMWWCCESPTAIELFQRVDPERWEETHHNPVKLLARVQPEQLDRLCTDDVFLSHLERVHNNLQEFLGYRTWANRVHASSLGGQPRLLFHGIRPARMPAHLFGRAGHPGRRPSEIGQ